MEDLTLNLNLIENNNDHWVTRLIFKENKLIHCLYNSSCKLHDEFIKSL